MLTAVDSTAISIFVDILVELTNTVSVSEAKIQITLLIVRRGTSSSPSGHSRKIRDKNIRRNPQRGRHDMQCTNGLIIPNTFSNFFHNEWSRNLQSATSEIMALLFSTRVIFSRAISDYRNRQNSPKKSFAQTSLKLFADIWLLFNCLFIYFFVLAYFA